MARIGTGKFVAVVAARMRAALQGPFKLSLTRHVQDKLEPWVDDSLYLSLSQDFGLPILRERGTK